MAYRSNFTGAQIDAAIEKAHKTGSVDPTASTVGVLGQRYFNTTTGSTFECTATITVDEVTTYTWRNVIANNLTETVAGKALDATKGKALNDIISNHEADLVAHSGNKQCVLRQAFINGNFDVWQRGTTFSSPASGTYLADRWKINESYFTPPTTTITRENIASELSNASNALRIAVSGAGTGISDYSDHGITQTIENGTRFLCGLNKKITVSFWARSSITNKRIGVYAIQDYGTGGSPSGINIMTGNNVLLTSNWQKISITMNTFTLAGKIFGTNNDDKILFCLNTLWGTSIGIRMQSTIENYASAGTIDIAQVQLNAGDVALPFSPKSYAEELIACQRYYQQRSANNINTLDLRPVMRVTPTVTGGASPYSYDAEF